MAQPVLLMEITIDLPHNDVLFFTRNVVYLREFLVCILNRECASKTNRDLFRCDLIC